ncbi:RteC domain-containing protein [Mucilaginibacter ginsenosidivorax]|uniref:RteC protein n=1 Tax=Mucilaginibacter ginsenosidivorax TaxID=862126 RepID=A0A5B8W7H4_9SPHI|nr:RteC domain-containing protein [Mucilaginibacter ginsenosidivorax]QEC78852.1 hypothetical protein FSB76_23950 [Mucilaginibacter ginsenosidivorax]
MIIEPAKARLVQLDEDLELFDEMGIPAGQKLNGKLNSIRQAIADLKTLLNQHPFSSTDEEIQFFKYVKPQFIARQLFALDIFTIETGKPVDTAEVIKNYFEQELKYTVKFHDQNKFMHQYYLFDGAELDALLFVRNVQPPSSLIPDAQSFDPEFSTAGDYVFARFIANEWVQEFLTDRLYSPEETERLSNMTKKKVTLKWTGDAINLAEMAYGIWLTGQINQGNAGIAEIVRCLEVTFQVSIGRPFRRWQSISSRKRVSQVKYIDQMKAAILKRLDDEYA